MKRRILDTCLAPGQLAMFSLGQEGFIFKFDEQYILIDGYLTDYVDRVAEADKGRKRNFMPPITPEELDFVDWVFCTHEHADHMDPETLAGIYACNSKARFIVPEPLIYVLTALGIPADRVIGARADEKLKIGNVNVTPVPAAHEQLERDEMGRYAALGYRFEFGPLCVYHAGDCCIYDGLEERVQNTDIAMLPVNGRDYYRFADNLIGNMDAREAALLASHIGAKLLVPMHIGLYPNNDVSVTAATEEISHYAPDVPCHFFKTGERMICAK